MSEKIELKEKLAAIDLGASSMWSEMDEDQKKALKAELFILNRYVSSVSGQKREIQEHFVLTVNEYYNKHWASLQQHPELLWKLLCACSHESNKIFFHQWIGFKQKKGDTKRIKFLLEIYPNRKLDELEMLVTLMPLKEFKELAANHGYSDKEITKLF